MALLIKTPARRARRVDGFTIVETVAAVCMLAFIGIIGSRALLNSTRSIANTRYHQKASTLGEMVLQQYTSFAAQDYKNLGTNDVGNPPQAPQPASVFFHRSDNMGFDGMGITSHTDYATDLSTATVTVTISWNEGSSPKSYSFIKTFAPRTTLLGGTVQVYVKTPCNNLQDPAAIAATCPGLANFSVSAPGYQGSIPPQTTDINGQALLKNVAVGISVAVTVQTPVPSSYTISNGSPGFVQGYYALDPMRNVFSVYETTPTNVEAGALTTVVITNFVKAGTIHGTVKNDSTGLTPPAPVSNMQIEIHNGQMTAPSGYYGNCSYAVPCTVFSDNSGAYTFNNVIASSYTYVIYPIGNPGSSPEITPSDPRFSWGCISSPSKNPATDYVIPPASWGTGSYGQPDVVMPLEVEVMGWLNATLSALWSAQTVTPLTVMINDITNNFPPRNPPPAGVAAGLNMWGNPNGTPTIPTAAGALVAYNIVAAQPGLTSNPMSTNIHFWNVATAPSGSNPGFYINDDWGASIAPTARIGQENDFTLPVEPSYTLTGTIVDTSGVPLSVPGLTMSGWGFYNQVLYGSFTQIGNKISVPAGGNVAYQGFFPVNYKTSDIAHTDPAQNGGIKAAFVFANTAAPATVTIAGNAVDSITAQPAGGAPIVISTGGVNGRVTLWTDASGAFNSTQPIQVPYSSTVDAWIVCDNSNLTCVFCNPPIPPATTCATSQLTVDLSNYSVHLLSSLGTSPGYYYPYDLYEPVSGGVMSTPTPVSVTLVDQRVSGTITDNAGNPVAGINVPADINWLSQSVNTVTNAAGQFGPVWLSVNGRTSSSSWGAVNFDVTAQKSFSDPPAQTLPLAAEADPLVPLTTTVKVSPSGASVTGSGL